MPLRSGTGCLGIWRGVGLDGVNEGILPPCRPEYHPITAKHDHHRQPEWKRGHQDWIRVAWGPHNSAGIVAAVKFDGSPSIKRRSALEYTKKPCESDQVGTQVRCHSCGVGQRVDDGQIAIYGYHNDGVDTSECKQVHEHHKGLAESGVQRPDLRHGGSDGEGHDQHRLQ